MAIRPELINPVPTDPGTVASISDLQRRVNSLSGMYGVFGSGMTITGGTVETSDNTGTSRAWLTDNQGGQAGLFVSDGGGVIRAEVISGSTPGLYIYDTAGNNVAYLIGGVAASGLYLFDDSGNAVSAITGGSTNPGVFLYNNSGGVDAKMIPGSATGLYTYRSGTVAVQVLGGTLAGIYCADSGGNIALAISPSLFGMKFDTRYGFSGVWWHNGFNYVGAITGGTSLGGGNRQGKWSVQDDSNSNNAVVIISAAGGLSGVSIQTNGGPGPITASSFNVASDESIKDNVRDLADVGDFHALRPVRYVRKHTGQLQYGLIAQELQQVFPEIVREATVPREPDSEESEEVLLGYDLSSVVTLLVSELQRQHTRIQQLEESHAR